MRHPSRTPLDQWPSGWLKMEVASILNDPLYIMMYDNEKESKGYPITEAEMKEIIRNNRR